MATTGSMRILNGLDGLRALPPGAVISVGNFDGLHLGHQRILSTVRELRDATGASALAVVTFEPHPLTVLRPALAPPRLTPEALKDDLLAAHGVDALVVLPPTDEILNLSAEQFWSILRDDVRPRHMVEGGSFNFGKDRRGTIDRLREWSARSPVELHVIDAVTVALVDFHVVPVSSSLIRWLLAAGRVRDAAICLGRPYPLCGAVVKGHQRGRAIRVPTANLNVEAQMIPGDGVYAGRCTLEGRTYPVALSVGTMPTFGTNQRQVEAHLIGFDGDLYGRTLCVEAIDWIRDQQKFPDIDALKARLSRDLQRAAASTKSDAALPLASVSSSV